MTRTMVDATTIAPLEGNDGLDIQEAEYERMVELLRSLSPEDWGRPTDCTEWTVRDMVAHLVGSARTSAFPEFVRQSVTAMRDAKRTGKEIVDTLSALQVREHTHRSPAELTEALAHEGAKAVRRRRRLPGIVERTAKVPLGEIGRQSLRYFVQVILTRDVWMHRIDVSRATDREFVATSDHDGRIVADIVRDFAAYGAGPFTLHLTGPAGGIFENAGGAQPVTMDAIGFARALAGRADRTGLPDAPVLF